MNEESHESSIIISNWKHTIDCKTNTNQRNSSTWQNKKRIVSQAHTHRIINIQKLKETKKHTHHLNEHRQTNPSNNEHLNWHATTIECEHRQFTRQSKQRHKNTMKNNNATNQCDDKCTSIKQSKPEAQVNRYISIARNAMMIEPLSQGRTKGTKAKPTVGRTKGEPMEPKLSLL